VAVTDSKNCTFSASFTITEEAGPTSFTATTTASSCGLNNGKIVVGTISGGISPYTYSKDGTNFQTSSTFGALLAGTYSITVKDAKGCTFVKNVVVSNNGGPTDFTSNLKAATCSESNGEITVSSVVG